MKQSAIRHYILNGKIAVPCEDIMEWAKHSPLGTRVAETIRDNVRVSTVFLGLDLQWSNGPPMIFETMVFGGEHDEHQDRCSTWDEAEAMHKRVCAMVWIKP
jgi:hypothetical protein